MRAFDGMAHWFKKYLNSYFSTYCQNSTETTNLQPDQALFGWTYSNLKDFFFNKKTKNIQGLSKSKSLSFMTKLNSNTGNEII